MMSKSPVQATGALRPKVLILIASYNGANWISEQVASILKQEDVDLSIVVHDDVSTDNTANILAGLAADEPRLRLVTYQEPSGSASANFFRIIRCNAADGYDFVALADQDDVWLANKLTRATRTLSQTQCAGYSSATTAAWNNGTTRLLRQCPCITQSDFLFEGAGQGCTFLLKTAFYQRARSFLIDNESLTKSLHFHDWALYALARSWTLQWIFDPLPTMLYRQHESNDTGARSSATGALMRFNRIRSGWYARQLAGIATLCNTASPENSVISTWNRIITAPPSLKRRLSMIRFLIRGGRRRINDRIVLILSAAAGWI